MQQRNGSYTSSRDDLRNPGNMTWAETDRSWMKAKGRSVRTVLDSVDLLEARTQSRRRRKFGLAMMVAAGALGPVALLAFANGSGYSDGSALASGEESQEEAQDSGGSLAVGANLAAGGRVPLGDPASPSAALSVTGSGSGGPGSGSVTAGGGGGVNTPTNPFDNLNPPINGGGGGNGGDSGSDAVDVSGTVSGLLDLDGSVGGADTGDLGLEGTLPENNVLPDDGNLLDIDISGDPANTDDPADASAAANAGDTETNVNDDDLLGDVPQRPSQLSLSASAQLPVAAAG